MQFELVDFILVGIASFWAISSLARLMSTHREQRLDELRLEIQRERERLHEEAEEQRQRELAEQNATPPNSLVERRMNQMKLAADRPSAEKTTSGPESHGEKAASATSTTVGGKDTVSNPPSPAAKSVA